MNNLQWSDKTRTIWPLYLGFVLLTALIAAIFAFTYTQRQDYQIYQRSASSEQLLAKVFDDLQNAETGQRGFLLTGEQSYLEPYNQAKAAADEDFTRLANVLDGQPTDQSELSALRGLSDQKFTEMQTSIRLFSAGRHDEALALIRTGTGRALMDQIRAEVAKLAAGYQQRRDTRFRSARQAGNWLRVGAILALFAVIALAFASVRALTRKIGELSEANHRLFLEAEQREKISEQLRQSQKMEAVGQLTGGLAHDFNNMLAVILGSLNLAKRRIARGDGEFESFLDSAREGAERAATLTHRLLAFSRQQPLSLISVSPNKMVGGMSELLRRTLSEQIHFETVLAAGLWQIHTDPSQLENALINLAVNAKDAMPDGGKLTIETSNAFLDETYASNHVEVLAGQYVLIAVTDTGSGMPPDVIAKVFDPFFTTKPTGQGTGLGLSQVYGFVKQSGGHIKIYSEPGQGTSVKLYLPRFVGDQNQSDSESSASHDVPAGRSGETVLIVEDEDKVRELAVLSMKELGYEVLEASNASQALRHIDSTARIDLLFTDVVMPDLNGRKLADEATRRRPALKVLFTTGFTRNAVVHNGTLDRGVDLISKPYSIDQLAKKVREVLDRPEVRAGAV